MLIEQALNFREAICCWNCKHYEIDYDAGGECNKYITDPKGGEIFKNDSGWVNVCDGHEKETD